MKKLSNKQKMIFVLSLIFFCTSIAVKIKNFNNNIQAIKKKDSIEEKGKQNLKNSSLNITPKKLKNQFVLDNNKEVQNGIDIKNRVSELLGTLDKAINYLKNNIDNKNKKEEIIILIDDCINALNSIENALVKVKTKDDTINAKKDIKKLKEDFKELKKVFKEGNLKKCKEILDKS
ncbi:hypothetical protein [Clostridium brassicae]|uniref:DUF8042 domain-containing protein n=1 Tax=Clostridium brassicae TaxID=2999072 RepID=A0ABT4DBP0_9CLOT|nr:hypothetical protein [Clostridium brassicae]MCY6959588.1 hypothetical protein [Clostridium brassicae]